MKSKILLVFSLVFLLSNPAMAGMDIQSNPSTNSTPPVTGDWIISTGEYISGVNYTVEGSVIINSPDPVTIINSTIRVRDAIFVQSDDVTISFSNVISYTNTAQEKHAIYLNGGNYALIYNNTINVEDNYFGHGIYVQGFSKAKIHNNTIVTTGLSAAGIYTESSNNLLIQDNNIVTTIRQAQGIYMKNTDDSSVKNNLINSSLDIGVQLSNTDNVTFIDNEIFGDTWGIYTDSSTDLNLINNSVMLNGEGSQELGMSMYADTHSHIERNYFMNGISMTKSNFSEFIRNEINTKYSDLAPTSWGDEGIQFYECRYNDFVENTIHGGSDEPALTVSKDNTGFRFINNTLFSTRTAIRFISLGTQDNHTFIGNDISNNGTTWTLISITGNNNYFANNTYYYNTDDDYVVYENGNNNTFVDNLVHPLNNLYAYVHEYLPELTFFQYEPTEYTLNWKITDTDLLNYTIYLNDTFVYGDMLSGGKEKEIYYTLNTSLPLGTYNYTIVILDEALHQVQRSSLVHIVPDPNYIRISGPESLEIDEGDQLSIRWYYENNSRVDPKLLIDGIEVDISPGIFAETYILYRIEDLSVGNHTITLVLTNELGTSIQYNVEVRVVENTGDTADSSENSEPDDPDTGETTPGLNITLSWVWIVMALFVVSPFRRRNK